MANKLRENVGRNGGLYSIRDFRTEYPLILMALPGLVFVFIFNYIPLYGIVLPFKDFNFRDGLLHSSWAGFKNFTFFFTSQDAFRVTFNTIKLNFLFITTGIAAQVALAVMLSELWKGYVRKVTQTMMFLPYFISWVIVAYIAELFLNESSGILNKIIQTIGLEPVSWFTTPGPWPTILTVVSLWKGVGFGSVIFLAVITGIDNEMCEAAAVDGASKLQQITRIILPQLVPMIILQLLISIGGIIRGDFGMIYNMTRDIGMLYPTTDVIDTYVYRALKTTGDIGMSSAVGLYQSVVGFILVYFSNWLVKKYEKDYALF